MGSGDRVTGVKIVMGYDGNVPFGPEVEAINRAYAEQRGYKFVCYRHLPDPNLDPYWNRVRIMQQELVDCAAVWWIDADALFLRRDVPLPEVTFDLKFSTDWNGICCGVMAVKNTPWAHKLLDTWLFLGNVRGDRIKDFDNGQFREQTVVKALRYYFGNFLGRVDEVSEALIQNPISQFNASALMLHMWSAYSGAEHIATALKSFQADGYQPHVLAALRRSTE